MPRKKLNKTKIKRDLSGAMGRIYNLMVDKIGHPDSNVPMSVSKLLEIHKAVSSAWKRVK